MRLIDDTVTVPSGWKLSTLEQACSFHNNLRFPINLETRRRMQGEYPYYGPTGVLGYLNEHRVEGTYVLLGEDGDHFLKFRDWSMTQLVTGLYNVNNHAHLIRGGDGCLTEWVHYF